MQNRDFEKNMQQKMEELKFTPADELWNKIEAGLPEKNKSRRWLLLLLFFVLCTAGSLLVWNNFKTKTNTAAPAAANKKSRIADIDSNTQNQPVTTTIPAENNTAEKESTTPGNAVATTAKRQLSPAALKINIKKGHAVDESTAPGETLVTANHITGKTKGTVKMKIKAPAVAEDEENNNAVKNDIETGETAMPNQPVTTTTAANNLKTDSTVATVTTTIADSLITPATDSTTTVTAKDKKKKEKTKWQFGAELAAGVSNVKSNIFSSSQVYGSAMTNNNGATAPGQMQQAAVKPANAAAFNTGFYAAKKINNKWTFNTGLQYNYQSNTIKVGSKVDSSANFSVDVNKTISAPSYYRSGTSEKYTNRYHLLEIPITMQYRFSAASPFYVEAGPSIAYLLQSNALVYSNRSQAFFTDKAVFNKLLLSINAGAAFTIANKSKLPVTIGYKMKYGMGSVVKSSFGKQHFINSLIYVRVPFKR